MWPSSRNLYSTGGSSGLSLRPCVITFAPISPSALSKSITLVSSTEPRRRSRRSCTEWWRMSSASSSWVMLAWNSKGSAKSEVSERVLDRRVVREDAIEGGQLEHDANLLVRRRQPEVAFRAAQHLEGGDHGSEAGAVDKADTFHVDHQPGRAVLDRVTDRCLESGSTGDVKAARGRDHRHTPIRLPCLYFQAHRSKRLHRLTCHPFRVTHLNFSGAYGHPGSPSPHADRRGRGGPVQVDGPDPQEPRHRGGYGVLRRGGAPAARGQRVRGGRARRAAAGRVGLRPARRAASAAARHRRGDDLRRRRPRAGQGRRRARRARLLRQADRIDRALSRGLQRVEAPQPRAGVPVQLAPPRIDGLRPRGADGDGGAHPGGHAPQISRSEEHTSELQSPYDLV